MSKAAFVEGNLMRHVTVMSLTTSIGIMAIFVVDFVDLLFISTLGKSALAAAIGYAGTVLFFTNAISMGMSIIAGSLVSKAIGAGNDQEAREYATTVAVFAGLISILIPALILPNLDSILMLLGAKGDTLKYAASYCSIILPTMCFMGIAMTAMAILRAYGDAKSAMFVTLLGGGVNAALDPIFIFVLDLDLDGAAYASVLGRASMMAYAVWLVVKKYDGFVAPTILMVKRDFYPVLKVAVPSILTNLATPVGAAIIIRVMAGFGPEAVAAMAVIGRLTPLAFSVVLALSSAMGPIIGQNFGAGHMNRVRSAFIDGIVFLVVYVLFVSLVLVLTREFIAELFNADGQMLNLIYLFCGPLALFQIFNGLIFVCNASYNNLGHPFYSTYLNWGKNTIGTLPFVIVGSSIAGASGVLIGQAIGGMVLSLLGLFFAWRLITTLRFASSEENHFAIHTDIHKTFCDRHW